MLLIMANLLFVNSVLSKVGRHDTHALGGGSDFLLGITQDRACCMPAYLSEKNPCFFCGSENVWTAWEKLVSELGGISVSVPDAQGTYTCASILFIYFSNWIKSVRKSVLTVINVFIPVIMAANSQETA